MTEISITILKPWITAKGRENESRSGFQPRLYRTRENGAPTIKIKHFVLSCTFVLISG